MCVQEEERLVMEIDKDIIMTNMGKSMIVKGKLISFICYESNMVDVIYNTCWIDFGSTIHVIEYLTLYNQGRPNVFRGLKRKFK
jgi:hypothetical protein